MSFPRKMTDGAIARARDMADAGLSNQAIADEMGVHVNTLTPLNLRNGARGSPPHSEEVAAQIKLLYVDQGISAKEVAARLGLMSRNVVIGVAHRRGWVRSVETRRLNSKAGTAKAAFRPLIHVPSPATPIVAAPAVVGARPFIDRASGCPWIVSGEGVDAMACCGVVARGSYCAAHGERAYERPKTDGKALGRLLRRQIYG